MAVKSRLKEDASIFEEGEKTVSPNVSIARFEDALSPEHIVDHVVIEEPLEIIVNFQSLDEQGGKQRDSRSLAVTMRTPGQDFYLVLGFLYGEGLITSVDQVVMIQHWGPKVGRLKLNNTVKIMLDNTTDIGSERFNRYFTMNSSCGICGKSSLEALALTPPYEREDQSLQLSADTLYQLNDKIRQLQEQFDQTGAIHAAVLLDADGNVIKLMEDVGRHNAMDKLVGYALAEKWLPLQDSMIYFSGRLSYELVQKSVMAGVSTVISVGAPTNLAIEVAKEHDITVIGFLKSNRFNVYTGEHRVH